MLYYALVFLTGRSDRRRPTCHRTVLGSGGDSVGAVVDRDRVGCDVYVQGTLGSGDGRLSDVSGNLESSKAISKGSREVIPP